MGQSITISLFLQTTSVNGYIMTLSRSSSTYDHEFGLQIDGSGFLKFWDYSYSTSYGLQLSSSVKVNSGKRLHAAFVKNGNLGTLYINGISVGSATSSSVVTYSNTNLCIGKDYRDNVNYFNGVMDNIQVLPSSLNPDQVLMKYQQGISATAAPSTSPTFKPSTNPTIAPSAAPTVSFQPSARPSLIPTATPSIKSTLLPTQAIPSTYSSLINTKVAFASNGWTWTLNYFGSVVQSNSNSNYIVGYYTSFLATNQYSLKNGDFCSATNAPRSGTMTFTCSASSATSYSVVEGPTCFYAVTVSSPSYCGPTDTAKPTSLSTPSFAPTAKST